MGEDVLRLQVLSVSTVCARSSGHTGGAHPKNWLLNDLVYVGCLEQLHPSSQWAECLGQLYEVVHPEWSCGGHTGTARGLLK